MPRIHSKKLLAAGIVFAAAFFLLAPRSPLTLWLLQHGAAPEAIDYVDNALGLAGIILLLLAVLRIRVVEEEPGEARVRIDIPLWLILALGGALTFEGLMRLFNSLLGPQASRVIVWGFTALVFAIVAVAVGLLVARSVRRRTRVFVVVGRLPEEGESRG